ncbi:MAG: ATP-dependent metallopeptidase FtsH/Yme1/Tma family protein, partial [Candidatus Omnitrophota bacterium]
MANYKHRNSKKKKVFQRFPLGWILAIIIFYFFINSLNVSMSGVPREISYSDFYGILKDSPDRIKSVTKVETVLNGEFSDNTKFFLNIPENDTELLSLMRANLKHFEVKPQRTLLTNLLFSFGPIILLIALWWMMASRGEQLGNRIMTFGKVRPKVHAEEGPDRVTFGDVAGV